MATRTYNWLSDPPQAYPNNFLPPHTDQFYATKIPMYYDDQHRFNIDRALSKEDILKQSSTYPFLDTSDVIFADTPEDRAAHYSYLDDQSVLNLKHIDPQNITADDLKTVGHETMHQTFGPSGITAASNLLKGSIEPYNEWDYEQEGPKRATDYKMWDTSLSDKERWSNEHLLIDAIQNMDNPEFDISKLDQSLYQGLFDNNYHNALLDQVSEGLFKHHKNLYYKPKWAMGGNAPGEVRRGYFGLRDLFDRSALKYKNIMENYKKRRRAGPSMAERRPPNEGLGDAGIAEQIAAENRAKKKAAIQEAVNIQIGTSKGDGAGNKMGMPQGRDRGRARGRGETGQIAGSHHFSRGGLMDIPLPGRSRDI
jgi:hypothetical protein